MTPLTDAALASAIASVDTTERGSVGQGEREKLEAELCRRFMNRARLYGLKHLRFDVTLAEDLAQQVMMIVLEALRAGKVNDLERIDRFMLGTCRNVAHTMRRGAQKTTDTSQRLLRELGEPVTPPWEHFLTPRVETCLAGLSSREGRLLSLLIQEGASAQEAASALGTTPGNIRVMHHRALARLRACLEAAEPAIAVQGPNP